MHQITALTSLRFLAAFLVFVHHYMAHHGFLHFGLHSFGEMGDSLWAVLLFEMRYGVTLFFVLSGFLLLVRYQDSLFVKASFGTYWLKRFARIMPLYWITLTAYFLLHREPYWETPHYIIFYSLTQAFFFHIKWDALGVAWSLTVEECFYLLLPLIVLAIRYGTLGVERLVPTLRSRWIPVLVGVVVVYLTSHVLWFIGSYLVREELTTFAGFMSNKAEMRTYTIFGRFPDFAVGIVVGLIYLQTRNRVLRMGWLADLAIVASVVGILVMCRQIYYEAGRWPAWNNLETRDGWRLNFYNAVFSGVVIYFLCSTRSWITWLLSWRVFRYLGEISFAMYLLHSNTISLKLYAFVRDQQWGLVASIAFVYGILTVLSAFCYEVIERPAQHLILEKAGVLQGSVRRPTVLRLLGFARRTKDRRPRSGPPATGAGPEPLAC